MPTTVVHVRLDEKVKAKAEKALAAMGLSIPEAVRLFLARVATEKALPFELMVTTTTSAAIAEARTGGLRPFASVDDLIADLNAPPPKR